MAESDEINFQGNQSPLNPIIQDTDLPQQDFRFIRKTQPHCCKCSSQSLCDQLMQTDSVTVTPGTPLCDTVRSRGPKYN